jgi:hypothetical protein
MASPKCQFCGAQPLQVGAQPIDTGPSAREWMRSTLFHCEKCGAVLSIQTDPLDLVEKMMKALRGRGL